MILKKRSKMVGGLFFGWVMGLLLFLTLGQTALAKENEPYVYRVGTGISDITGPAAEVGMMGYANLDQVTTGIHTRLWSRAFIAEDAATGSSMVYVEADLGFITQGIKQQVIEKLRASYGERYTDANVILGGTHTHSGPGGYSHYALYNITVKGFIKENFDTIVNGIVHSIQKAHHNLEPGYIKVNSGTLKGVSVNRSLTAYLNNPAKERAKYSDSVDTTMTLMKFENTAGKPLGIINWFPVHCTSMGNDNHLISGDNKGYAAYLYEKSMGTNYQADKTFVAAFAQSNEGDASPNIVDGGKAGAGANDYESTAIAGQKQYEKAKSLADSATTYIHGSLDFRLKYADFSNITIAAKYTDGVVRRTAPAALGFSFATGAEDGPSGISMFHEGMTSAQYTINSRNSVNALLRLTQVIPAVKQVSGTKYPELWNQHAPKPVLLATSQAKPYPWTPEVLPVQIVKIGQVRILSVPAEFTTMSGRRLIEAVKEVFDDEDGIYVISGLSNAYSDYVATEQEYDLQHYEGASTLFGRWTLAAYLQEFSEVAQAMKSGAAINNSLVPRDLRNKQSNFQTGVVFDSLPLGKKFGSVVKNVQPAYAKGQTASASFWAGHPKNDLKNNDTYLQVQRKVGNDWVTVANDWDWETKYVWKRTNTLLGFSQVTVEWHIPADASPGTYRLVHHGNYLYGWNRRVYPYTGASSTFKVLS